MNIKEAIDRGLYPKDEKGRALVPTVRGGTLVVAATDKPGPCPIVGWITGIDISMGYYADSADLLPPPPRKVKVSSYHCLEKPTGAISSGMGSARQAAEHIRLNMVCKADWIVINLTGEYDEEWPS